MNDYTGLAPPWSRAPASASFRHWPELLRDGRLVEIMPAWRFQTFDLSVVHLGNRYTPSAGTRLQGIRGTDGTLAVSNASNLKTNAAA